VPGTRETDLLIGQHGAAGTLRWLGRVRSDAASGVMRYLEERSIGFKTATRPVPIVPAAILIDLQVSNRRSVHGRLRVSRLSPHQPANAEGNVGR
jgi:L-aminopeptidase/D-esterase-like protein